MGHHGPRPCPTPRDIVCELQEVCICFSYWYHLYRHGPRPCPTPRDIVWELQEVCISFSYWYHLCYHGPRPCPTPRDFVWELQEVYICFSYWYHLYRHGPRPTTMPDSTWHCLRTTRSLYLFQLLVSLVLPQPTTMPDSMRHCLRTTRSLYLFQLLVSLVPPRTTTMPDSTRHCLRTTRSLYLFQLLVSLVPPRATTRPDSMRHCLRTTRSLYLFQLLVSLVPQRATGHDHARLQETLFENYKKFVSLSAIGITCRHGPLPCPTRWDIVWELQEVWISFSYWYHLYRHGPRATTMPDSKRHCLRTTRSLYLFQLLVSLVPPRATGHDHARLHKSLFEIYKKFVSLSAIGITRPPRATGHGPRPCPTPWDIVWDLQEVYISFSYWYHLYRHGPRATGQGPRATTMPDSMRHCLRSTRSLYLFQLLVSLVPPRATGHDHARLHETLFENYKKFVSLSAIGITCAATAHDHARLHETLFENYKRFVRPVFNQSEALQVNISFFIIMIHDLVCYCSWTDSVKPSLVYSNPVWLPCSQRSPFQNLLPDNSLPIFFHPEWKHVLIFTRFTSEVRMNEER